VRADLISKCTNPTGIEDANISASESIVFPNPFNSSFNIKSIGSFDYSILDLNGKELENGTGANNVTTGEKLPAGMYVIKLNKGKTTEYIKTTKSN
jgi:hypothetical protein